MSLNFADGGAFMPSPRILWARARADLVERERFGDDQRKPAVINHRRLIFFVLPTRLNAIHTCAGGLTNLAPFDLADLSCVVQSDCVREADRHELKGARASQSIWRHVN